MWIEVKKDKFINTDCLCGFYLSPTNTTVLLLNTGDLKESEDVYGPELFEKLKNLVLSKKMLL